MFSTSHSRYSLTRWIAKAFTVKWRIERICSQELGFVWKSEQREALELLLRGKDVFRVLPTGFDKSLIYQMWFTQRVRQVQFNGRRPSLLSCLAKKRGIIRKHMTFTSCKNAACSNALFSLSSRLCFGGKCFDWAIVNFGRLLNIFHTDRSWHAYWFSLVGMICPLMQDRFLSWPL